jgi:hypothetical protein
MFFTSAYTRHQHHQGTMHKLNGGNPHTNFNEKKHHKNIRTASGNETPKTKAANKGGVRAAPALM